MFGPERTRPCPMCTNLLGAWEGNAADIGQKISLAVVARSPIERLIAWKQERGWRNLRLFSDLNGAYSRDYFGHPAERLGGPGLQRVHPPRRDDPPFLVGRDDGRRPPTLARTRAARPTRRRLWMVLDCTPEGRGADWYPKLEYA